VTGYILKRTLQAIPILLGASTLIFFLMHAAPGDPTSIYIRPDIDPIVIEQLDGPTTLLQVEVGDRPGAVGVRDQAGDLRRAAASVQPHASRDR